MTENKVGKKGNVMRYCSQCYATLCESEKTCPNECEAVIEEFDFNLGKFITPSVGLCCEHPFMTVQKDGSLLGFEEVVE